MDEPASRRDRRPERHNERPQADGMEVELAEVRHSSRAALNLMEDAVLARKRLETLNETLCLEIDERKRAEALSECQRQALQRLAEGAPLDEVLEFLVQLVERHADNGVLGSIVLLNEAGTHFQRGVGASIPQAFNAAVAGIAVSSASGICCHAVGRREAVVVPDFCADPQWACFAKFVAPYGLRAGWSAPILGSGGRVLGTFANYYRKPCDPTPRDLKWVEVVTRTAGIAIERAHAEQALRSSREQLQAIVNDSPLGVYLVDSDFRICHVNPTALPVFGDLSDLIGRDFEEVIHILWPTRYADEMVALFRHTLETGEPYHTSERIEQRLDRGVTEYYEWQVHRLPLPDGRQGVVCYFRDISAQVQARRALEAADRQKDEFLAMLGHELRNPLAPIGNASEILSRLFAKETRAQAPIEIIKRQTAQLTRLVDDLLDVSRITQGRIELKRRPLDLASVVAQAIETVEPLLRAKQHNISFGTSSYQPLYVSGDLPRLVQCVSNVLSNAAKYTDGGGKIRLQTRAEAADAIIEISDTGTGIAPELLPRVFDPFVQGDRTLDRAQGGLGIGLSVVKRLVEMHDGEVIARSPGVGHGSTFEIRLPRIACSQARRSEVPQARAPLQRVLVVDDNADAASSLAMLLSIQGHEAQAVYSGKEALRLIESFKPDVALVDLGLPEMNGYELAQQLRAIPKLNGIRLVALTGYGRAEDRQRTQAAGFDDHLVKPVDLPALERSLAGIAGKPEDDWL